MNTTRLSLLLALLLGLWACQEPRAPEPAPAQPAPEAAQPAEAPTQRSTQVEAALAPLSPQDVAALLRPQDVAQTLGFQEELVADTLQGIPHKKTYASARLRPAQDPKQHGVALQWWREGQAAAAARMQQHQRTYKNAQPTRKVDVQAFFALQSNLLHLCWLAEGGQAVAVLTCHQDRCDKEGLAALAQRIQLRQQSMNHNK